jgi:hypothetical protein
LAILLTFYMWRNYLEHVKFIVKRIMNPEIYTGAGNSFNIFFLKKLD